MPRRSGSPCLSFRDLRTGPPVTVPAAVASFPLTVPCPPAAARRERRAMTRIPSHSVADAPDASRSLLEEMIQFSPTGRPLNMHAQMAHSPAVLQAYVSLRRAAAHQGTLDQRIR